jgi:hypothetical protein
MVGIFSAPKETYRFTVQETVKNVLTNKGFSLLPMRMTMNHP